MQGIEHKRTYTKRDSFYDDLVTMLFQLYVNMVTVSHFLVLDQIPHLTKQYLASCGFAQGRFQLEISHYPEILMRLHHVVADLIGVDEQFTLTSRHQTYYAYYFPFQIMEPVSKNSWPDYLDMVYMEKSEGDLVPNTSLTQILSSPQHQFPMKAAIRSSFISYFEAYKGRIEDKYSRQASQWPAVWNFARIVRNACGHGGTINISNSNSDAVLWRNYRFDASSNGTSILFGRSGLSTVDIIMLFEDMDKVLPTQSES